MEYIRERFYKIYVKGTFVHKQLRFFSYFSVEKGVFCTPSAHGWDLLIQIVYCL